MGDLVSAVVSVAALCGFGYLIYYHGIVGTWETIKRPIAAFNHALIYGRPRRPQSLPSRPQDPARLKRLQAAAAVPMEQIIAAAERRATHPDEPEPDVLAALDPATWERPVDTEQVKPLPLLWPNPTPSEVDDVEYRFKQLQRSGQTMVLPPGMDYQVVPVIRANRARVGLCPEPSCRMEASHCPHTQTPDLPGVVITTNQVRRDQIRRENYRAAEQEMQRSVARAFRVGAIRP